MLEGAFDADAVYFEVKRPTKIKLQLEYTRNQNILEDIKIILYTFYRGAKPIFWAMLDGVEEFGVTVHIMTSDIDKGYFVAQRLFKNRKKEHCSRVILLPIKFVC